MSKVRNENEVCFDFGKKLPTAYDIVILVFEVCTKPTSQKMGDVINKIESKLREQWIKAFGVNHVSSRSTVKRRLEKLVKEY